MVVIEDIEIRGVRLFFDDDHYVVEQRGEALGE
jgi:hypothetical protein